MSSPFKLIESLKLRRLELMADAFGPSALSYEAYLALHARCAQIEEDVQHVRKLNKGEDEQ